MIDEDYDVIVTGAGPAGLSSAMEAAKFSDKDWNSLIKYAAKFNEYPDIGLRFLRSEFSIRDLFKISPRFALKLGFKAI